MKEKRMHTVRLMIDILFNICYAPFQKMPNGRLAALIWLTPSLSFFTLGTANILFYFLIPGFKVSPTVVGIVSLVTGAIIAYYINRVYVVGKKDTGNTRFPLLHSLLILVLIIGSLIFFSVSLYKFRYA